MRARSRTGLRIGSVPHEGHDVCEAGTEMVAGSEAGRRGSPADRNLQQARRRHGSSLAVDLPLLPASPGAAVDAAEAVE